MSNSMAKEKVLCLFPRFYTGGVSKALSFVANTCDAYGMEVHCVSMTSEPETIFLRQGIYRHTIDTERRDSKTKSYIYKILFVFRFRRLVTKVKPDVVIVFRPDLAKAVLYSIRGLNIPVIGSERGNPLLHNKKRIAIYNKMYNRCAAVVFQTAAARDVYQMRVKTAIIPNPAVSRINLEVYDGIKKGRNLLSVSRLDKGKNIEGLLRAFAMVRNQMSGRKLFLYGDGPQQEELEDLTSKLGIKGDVIFAGNVNDFSAQKDNASIFVLNTLSEGMPNALIEAMMSGYACICTDCPIGAPRWLSDNERRVKLVPVKDDEALSKAILEIALNDEKAKTLAQNALEVRELLNPKRIGDMWLKLINEVLDEHNH